MATVRGEEEILQVADDMASLVVNLDKLPAIGQVIDDRTLRVELRAALVKIGRSNSGWAR